MENGMHPNKRFHILESELHQMAQLEQGFSRSCLPAFLWQRRLEGLPDKNGSGPAELQG